MSHGWGSYYDRLAPSYDEATAASGWYPNERAREALAELDLTPRTVLDLGSGTGQTAAVLAAAYPEAQLTLVEASSAMAELAARACPGARVVVADLDEHLSVDDRVYDLVTAVGCLELVADLPASLAAAAARVAPGGHLLATHEVLLDDGGTQSAARTVVDAEQGWVVHRHTSTAVEAAARRAGLERVCGREFVAYRRGGLTAESVPEDAIYELVVWATGERGVAADRS